jgi:hypothetical protein
MKILISEEEKKRIRSLYHLNEQGLTTSQMENPDNQTDDTEDKSNEYPNYCLYPKFAKDPSSTLVQGGASGKDLYIDGHCLYAQPKESSIKFETSGVWLPNTGDTRIGFWSQDKREKYYKVYKSYLDTVTVGKTKLSYDDIKEQVNNLYKDGLVYAFKINNVVYKPAITYAPDHFKIAFAGFYVQGLPQSDETRYKSPKWVDKRNKYERFIDEYGIAVQLATAALTILLAPVTGGGSLALLLEIGLELGVGLPVAIREWQRGDRIDSAFSVITSLLPALKLSKQFTGIKKSAWEGLSRSLRSAPPSSASPEIFARWVSMLDPEESKLLHMLIDDDAYHLNKLLKQVEGMSPNTLNQFLISDIRIAMGNNPDIVQKFKFWKTIGGRDLKRNLMAGGVSFLLALFLGDKLDANDAGKLDKLWQEIPDTYKPEFYDNIVNNPEKIPEIIESLSRADVTKLNLYDKSGVQKDLTNYLNTKVRDIIGDDKYIETGDDSSEGLKNETINDKELDSLKQNGWISIDDWDGESKYDESTMRQLNGLVWFKLTNGVEPEDKDTLKIK